MNQTPHFHKLKKYILITCAGGAAASSCLGVYFVAGDWVQLHAAHLTIQEGSFYSVLTRSFEVWGNGFWRPAFTFLLSILYWLFGLNAFFYHLVSLTLHALNACLLCTFLRERNQERSGVWAALLFALHPAPWQAVAWIAAMSDLLTLTWILCALITFQRHLQRGSIGPLAASLVFCALALMTKEIAIGAAPVLFLLDRWGIKKNTWHETLRRRGWFYATLAVASIAYIAFTLTNVTRHSGILPAFSFSFPAMAETLLRYLTRLLNPFSGALFPFHGTIREVLFWRTHPLFDTGFGLAALAGFCAIGYWGKREYRFWIGWIVLALLPVSVWSDYMASRYVYLACAPFCALTGSIFEDAFQWLRARKFRWSVITRWTLQSFAAAALVLFLMTHWFTPSWNDYIRHSALFRSLRQRVMETIPRNMEFHKIWWIGPDDPNSLSCRSLLQILNKKLRCGNLFYVPYSEYEKRLREREDGVENLLIYIEGSGVIIPAAQWGNRFAPLPESAKPEPVELPENTLIVTDNLKTTRDLSGSVDSDLENARSIALRWNAGTIRADDFHLYVSIDGGPSTYLGRTGAPADYYEWKLGQKLLNPQFINGPEFGHTYLFRVHPIRNNAAPRLKPIRAKAPIHYQKGLDIYAPKLSQ